MEFNNKLQPVSLQNQNVQNNGEELYKLLSRLSKYELLNIAYGDLNFEGNNMNFREALDDAFYSFERSGKNIQDIRDMIKSKRSSKK